FSMLISLCINVNRFSMHALYRNRLVRAFLGSARAGRRVPDPFTSFDPTDNLPLACVQSGNKPDRLFQVINVAMNVVAVSQDDPVAAGGAIAQDKRAWQERKAESFTMTRLHCGNPNVGYRPTHLYGGGPPPRGRPANEGGLTLGTAMAISGA